MLDIRAPERILAPMTEPVRLSRIRAIRVSKQMPVDQVARSCGVHLMTVYAWETGKRRPSLLAAQKLAEVLGCTLDDLFPAPEEATA